MVSNRVAPIRRDGTGVEGGLAIALQAALKDRGGVWFGWSGDTVFHEGGEAQVTKIGRISYATLDLVQRDYDEYYSGFANSVLWPLFHNRLDLTDFSRRDRAGYQRVNAKFARRLLPLLEADDVIWVHDYHFIPLGEYLRQAGCRQRLGFFLHIPWPPMELLVTLPGHEALVRELCPSSNTSARKPEARFCLAVEYGLSVAAPSPSPFLSVLRPRTSPSLRARQKKISRPTG